MIKSFERGSRLTPLPPDHNPALKEQFDVLRHRIGFDANSELIMQRKPNIAKAWAQLRSAVFDPDDKVPAVLKRLIGHVASRSAGCQYCMAHTANSAVKLGAEEEKLQAVWDYQTSSLYTPAERAALDVAVAAGCVPNAVTDEMFVTLKNHWTDEEIVEIISVIALFGFLNRWNDTLATTLEDPPLALGAKLLASSGWDVGKHRG